MTNQSNNTNFSARPPLQDILGRAINGTKLSLVFFAFLIMWGVVLPGQMRPLWQFGFATMFISILFWPLGFVASKTIKRAYQIHLFYALITLPGQVLLWLISLGLTSLTAPTVKWVLNGVAVFIVLIAFITFYESIKLKLIFAQVHNETSGRLNRSSAIWNLTAPLWLDHPDLSLQEKWRWLSVWRFVLPFTTSLGYIVAEAGERGIVLLAVANFVLAYCVAHFAAFELGVAAYLRHVEKTIGRKISIAS